AVAKGLEAGKSTFSAQDETPSEAPLSPAATRTLTPMVAASSHAPFKAARACAVQELSGLPQLIETTEGRFAVSWRASLSPSRNPRSVLGAKYTTTRAPGATDPATSMSSSTSPSGPSGFPVGAFPAPSTETTVTFGAGTPSWPK